MDGPDANGNFFTFAKDIINAAGQDGVFAGGPQRTIETLDFGQFMLQIGPNKSQELGMQIPKMTIKAMKIEHLHVKSWEGAQLGIDQADGALEYVAETRGRLGAYQNRLEHTHTALGVTDENMENALSRIYDTDIAREMTLLSTSNVMMQAGMAILAQANQRPQQILQLLS
jgi:flagellin